MGELEIKALDFPQSPAGPQKAVVIRPMWAGPQARFPLLIALHGRGESNHGLDVGAWGWVHDYWLDRAISRLHRPPLDQDALQRLPDPRTIEQMNADLQTRPFHGLIVACPYTPDILKTRDLGAAELFGHFVTDTLLPSLRNTYPIVNDRHATGVDGVSLGGRVALLVGLARPDVFGAVGSLQAALDDDEALAFAERARQAMDKVQGDLRIRVLTSDADPFQPAIAALARAAAMKNVSLRYDEVTGPHDYAFNRGPGAYEMLLWHDRVLRGLDGSYRKAQ